MAPARAATAASINRPLFAPPSIRLRAPPAAARSGGAALIIAWLFGAVKKDKPGAERRLTQRSRSSGCSVATTISKSSAATQIGIPADAQRRGPAGWRARRRAARRADGDQNDRQLEAGRPPGRRQWSRLSSQDLKTRLENQSSRLQCLARDGAALPENLRNPMQRSSRSREPPQNRF